MKRSLSALLVLGSVSLFSASALATNSWTCVPKGTNLKASYFVKFIHSSTPGAKLLRDQSALGPLTNHSVRTSSGVVTLTTSELKIDVDTNRAIACTGASGTCYSGKITFLKISAIDASTVTTLKGASWSCTK